MTGMARRSTSARLVGRDGELADLLAAARAEDLERPVILLTGEAGIGKTRLLSELTETLRSAPPPGHITVARAACVRLAEADLPFSPILDILADLRDGPGSMQVERARESLGGLGSAASPSPEARTMRFIEAHEALVAAAAGERLAIIVDDLHWADKSTLDLLFFLARRMRGTRMQLIASYRSDELHRRHPLRPVIAELSRGFVRERIELRPLDREAVVAQIEALRGGADDALVEAIVNRADGNPFFVEELVALSPDGSPLPETLRDVLLARIGEVDEVELRILAAGAVLSCSWEIDVLQEMVSLDPETVLASVATAVDGAILSADPDGRSYRFRHALLEEAVHDDLLPGQRVHLHRRAAAVLQGRIDAGIPVPPAELAFHLDRAGQQDAAIEAYLSTADAAFRAFAWAEGLAAFERADELLQVHDENPELRRSLAGLAERAANAMNWTGSSGRAIALLRSTIERAQKTGDTPRAVSGLVTLGRILNDAGDEIGAREANAAAVRLQPPDLTTPEGIDLVIGLSGDQWIPGHTLEALRLIDLAVGAAEKLGNTTLLFRALVDRAVDMIALGHLDRGTADLERAQGLQEEHGWLDTYGHMATNAGLAFADIGELERAREMWTEGLRMSGELGIARSWDPWNLPGLALYGLHSGRWEAADGSIAEARAYRAQGMPMAWNEMVAASLAAGRGDIAAADASIALMEQHTAGIGGEWDALIAFTKARRADAVDDPNQRLEQAELAIGLLQGLDTYVLRSRLAVEAAAAAADLVATARPSRDERRIEDIRRRSRAAAQLAADVDAGTTIPGTKSVPWTRANAQLAALEARRAEGADDPDAWPSLADAFRALGMLPHVAEMEYRGAASAIRAGGRAVGATRLRKAAELARSIGMVVLEQRIRALARAARIDLLSAEPATPPNVEAQPRPVGRWGLSTREREVLELLAAGRTNGEIGAALFISTKTASVHVTHILNKLGVSSRVEAALLANQAGVLA